MTIHNLDPAADFVDRAGTDQVGAELTGPGGLQALIRGTSAAPVLAIGDTIVFKAGVMAQNRLILADCNGTDVSAWEVGDVVRDNNGGGEWTGVVVQERDIDATGLAADDILLFQLDSSYEHDDIILGSGINNVTKVLTSTLTSADGNPILWDGITPTSALPIFLIGSSTDWNERGATNGFIIDGHVGGGGSNPTVSFWDCSGGPDYFYLDNVTFQNSTSHPIIASTGTCLYWRFVHCQFDACGGENPSDNAHYYGVYDFTIFSNILAGGEVRAGEGSRFYGCSVRDGVGPRIAQLTSFVVFYSCLFTGNNQEMFLSSRNTIINCVFDGSISIQESIVASNASVLIGNRFVNTQAGKFAIRGVAGTPSVYVNDNLFFNPLASGDTSAFELPGDDRNISTADVQAGSNSDGLDADFNIELGKEGRSTPHILNWDV